MFIVPTSQHNDVEVAEGHQVPLVSESGGVAARVSEQEVDGVSAGVGHVGNHIIALNLLHTTVSTLQYRCITYIIITLHYKYQHSYILDALISLISVIQQREPSSMFFGLI